MSGKNKLDPSINIIEDFFEKSDVRSFTENRFAEIFDKNKDGWNMPTDWNSHKTLAYLVRKKAMVEHTFLNDSNEKRAIYSWKSNDEFTAIAGLKTGAYFSHYSAMYLHQMSLQVPKTIYLNAERTSATNQSESNVLTQDLIDKAFSGSQRKSLTSFSFQGKKIILLNGKFTNRLGVDKVTTIEQCYEYTDIERTLIDISVRPVYAGGVFEVAEAYKRVKGRMDPAKLANYLTRLDFIYPYHQVLGFYMERAGYSEHEIEYFRKEAKFNFYLTYDIRNKEFSQKWKLFYPKGF